MENEPDIFWDLPDEFQSLIGTVQRLSYNKIWRCLLWVSISYRYGSTTVFTAFHVFIIPYFYRFSIFSPKVGQPLHSKFPQSLDSTGFFIFVKIGSEVHRLFSRFFAVFGTFPCCFCSGSLDFTALEVHRLFYRIFSNLLFECPTLNFYRKPKI